MPLATKDAESQMFLFGREKMFIVVVLVKPC